MSNLLDRGKAQEYVIDEGVVRVNVGFVINGTANPLIAQNIGDGLVIQQVTRVGAGNFTFALKGVALALLGSSVTVNRSGGATNMIGNLDTVSSPTAGTYMVWTQVATVPTDPATGSIVLVELVLKCATRKAQL